MVDDQDRLVRVDPSFYRFAEENLWAGSGASLGRSLWDFVAGEEMRKLQRMLLRRVRGRSEGVELTFRCDSPVARREMDIWIAPSSGGRLVLFATRLRAEEPRDFEPLLDFAAERNADTLAMCGWCDRFKVGDEWLEVEATAARLGLFRRSALPTISHDICPDCSELLLAA